VICCSVVGTTDFYSTALNAGWSSQEKAVCLSVSPSVKCLDCDETEERNAHHFSGCVEY